MYCSRLNVNQHEREKVLETKVLGWSTFSWIHLQVCYQILTVKVGERFFHGYNQWRERVVIVKYTFPQGNIYLSIGKADSPGEKTLSEYHRVLLQALSVCFGFAILVAMCVGVCVCEGFVKIQKLCYIPHHIPSNWSIFISGCIIVLGGS